MPAASCRHASQPRAGCQPRTACRSKALAVQTGCQPLLVLSSHAGALCDQDDVLPVEDAYKYQEDLPNCVGVTLIPSAQHAPALENPGNALPLEHGVRVAMGLGGRAGGGLRAARGCAVPPPRADTHMARTRHDTVIFRRFAAFVADQIVSYVTSKVWAEPEPQLA